MVRSVSDASSEGPGAKRFELEAPCDHCDGDGRELTSRGLCSCTNCNGTGLAPTTLGARILDFVRRHNPSSPDSQNGI